ncbi:MAG: hypothetical protein Q8O30_05960 [Candidatus Omnitrophota bacterium]|nr:hypothetical protein [Candidatus Omnitrophota bacterium]
MARRKIAGVLLPIALDKEFDYSISPAMAAKKGMRVLVDLRGRKIPGIITSFKNESKIKNLKPILDILDTYPALSAEHIHFAQILSKFYPYNAGEFLFMMLPLYLRKARRLKILPSEKERGTKQERQKTFVKADTFNQRYGLWRDQARQKLETGSVLICFPQVSYLLEAKKIIDNDFGAKVKVIHSYESEKELFKNWQDSRTKTLILGTRLAIFYYPRDLNLIIVEEENSPFYFQEEKPFYHLLQVALLLSKLKNVDLVLSADYPTLYTYKFIKDEKIFLHDNPESKKEIKVIAIDRYRKGSIINPVLAELLRKNIEDNKRIVVFYNKKGYASVIACSSCGYIFKCSRCSGFLRLSLKENKGICPYCAKKEDLPKICKKCNCGYIKTSGSGIEKIELAIRNIFPQVKIAYWQERKPDTQIILSTSQILSSLYGNEAFDVGFVLDADRQMSHLDYEINIDTFIYLKKLSLFFKNNLYVFTQNKDSYVFTSLNQPWKIFYDKELSQRKELNLPPFGFIAKITLRTKDENKLFSKVENLYNKLKEKTIEVYGPFKEQPFKLRGKFRYMITAKSQNGYFLRKTLKEEIRSLRSSSVKVAVAIK